MKMSPAGAALFVVLCTLSLFAQDKNKAPAFTINDASQLLSQVREGLEGRSQKKLFSAFALSQMTNGPLFKQQITGFFNQTDAIRIHLNLVEVAEFRALVDAEMEADPRDNSLPVHKHARLTFIAERSGAGWKFTGLEPRSFFSLQP